MYVIPPFINNLVVYVCTCMSISDLEEKINLIYDFSFEDDHCITNMLLFCVLFNYTVTVDVLSCIGVIYSALFCVFWKNYVYMQYSFLFSYSFSFSFSFS
jgi:hypothetical protein